MVFLHFSPQQTAQKGNKRIQTVQKPHINTLACTHIFGKTVMTMFIYAYKKGFCHHKNRVREKILHHNFFPSSVRMVDVCGCVHKRIYKTIFPGR